MPLENYKKRWTSAMNELEKTQIMWIRTRDELAKTKKDLSELQFRHNDTHRLLRDLATNYNDLSSSYNSINTSLTALHRQFLILNNKKTRRKGHKVK